MIHPCDLCQSNEGTEIHPGVLVCSNCGFVYVPGRRDPAAIARAWSEVYASGAYDPSWPGVRARLFYVAEWLDQNYGLAGKSVLDIGAGRGFFLEEVRRRGAHPVGLEPDVTNAQMIASKDIACFKGAIEDNFYIGQYDIVTILWTLENTGDCIAMLKWAKRHLNPGGCVAVATGSRLMVPPRKPWSRYVGTLDADLHCFRFSVATLARALLLADFDCTIVNDFEQNDVLLMIGVGADPDNIARWFTDDDPAAVAAYLADWARLWP